MRHAAIAVVLGILSITAGLAFPLTSNLQAQTSRNPQPPTSAPQSTPSFEAASIKVNRSGIREVNFGMPPGGRFTATNAPLREIVRLAYGVSDLLIVDAPDWIRAERFDIVAKADGNPERDQIFLMVRSLLADRFKLVIHRESRELPQYALLRAKPDGAVGPRLRPAAADCPALLAAAQKGTPIPRSNRVLCGSQSRPGTIAIGGMTMDQIATGLWLQLGRVVSNRTGLEGRFDLDLDFAPEPVGGAVSADAPASDAPSIFTAVQEQLGLKLESTKGPVEVLVIDRVERPTED